MRSPSRRSVRRRLAALLLTLAVAMAGAACGGGDDDDSDAAGGTSEEAATTTTAAAADEPLEILVTNDDGYAAEGIDVLVQALREEPNVEVTVVAPATDQSGKSDTTSPALPPHREATTVSGHEAVAVDGTPADSVIVALDTLRLTPDLVVSGINKGQNIGPFVPLSGTVGAARTAARRGIPALAVSQGLAEQPDFEEAAEEAIDWLRANRGDLAAHEGTVVNINVPTCPTGEVRGLEEVAVAATTELNAFEVNCTSTAAGFADDVSAFVNGFATLSIVPAA